jgi:hypothetical protein
MPLTVILLFFDMFEDLIVFIFYYGLNTEY